MQAAEDLFLSYGYVPPANFHNVIRSTHTPIRVFDERNNVHTTMSLAQLRYQINNAATPRQPYIHPALPSLPLSTSTTTKAGFARWCSKQDDVFKLMNVNQQRLAYKTFKKMISYVKRRVGGEYKFNNNDHDKRVAQLYGLLQALKTVDYTKYDVYLTLYDAHNRKSYIHLNANTINHINVLMLSTTHTHLPLYKASPFGGYDAKACVCFTTTTTTSGGNPCLEYFTLKTILPAIE